MVEKDDSGKKINELRRGLTDKQIRFVHELLANGGNQTQAAIAAGYSEASAANQASRMMKNDKVAAYKRACAEQLYKNLGITPEQIGLHLNEIFMRCMDAKPHETWDSEAKEYVPDGTWMFDSHGAMKALELLGKMCGAFEDRVKVDAGETIERYLASLGGREY